VIEVDCDLPAPQPLLQLLASDNLVWPLQQNGENPEGLALDTNPITGFAEFTSL
jgi:hypothetical protein